MKKLLLPLLLLLLMTAPASAELVTRITPTPSATAASRMTLRPSADEVKVYATASTNARIVGYIIVGGRQEVEVLRLQNDWCYVSFTSINGTSYGWIPASCFEAEATPAPTVTPTPTPLPVNSAYVCNPQDGSRLNLRTSPSSSSTSLGKYYTGTPLTLMGDSRNGYTRVKIGDVSGWMDSRYITTIPYSFVSETPYVYVSNPGSGLNLRIGPGTSYDKIGWYPHGTGITILGVRADEWCHVSVNGQTGYMSSELMSERFPWHFSSDAENLGSTVDSAATGTSAYVGVPVTSGLHLRRSATTASESLGVFYTGCPVTIISYTRTGWAYVKIGDMHGYMDASSLSAAQPYQTGVSRMISNAYGTGLNLRTQPDTSSTIIRLCSNYTTVTVLGDLKNGWCYVLYAADAGYMIGSRLIDR